MPRQPTGRPRGRPKGSGELGEQMRLTVRIPKGLYERLEEYVGRKHYPRGAPQLAVCVREALEEYLDNKGQTKNTPPVENRISRQTEKYISGQTSIVQESIRESFRQTENVPDGLENNNRQTKKVLPAGRQGGRKRSELGERILALLSSYPEGLSAEEIRVYLKPEKPIGDTLQGMVRTGKLRGVGSGQQKQYCLAGEE
jgi:hypothetical protein